MDQKTINAINHQVYQKYPEVRGAAPKVKDQAAGTYLLIYEGMAKTADGHPMRRTVRAVVTESGKITKLTSSK